MNDVKALVLVDIQNDYFPGGRWPLHQMDAAAAAAKDVLEQARDRAWPVFHVHHQGTKDAPFFRPDTTGAEIHASVAPVAGEAMILHAQLQAKGVTHIRLVGAMSQMCIDATARAASDLGYKVEIIANACAAPAVKWNDTEVPAPQVHTTIMAALNGTYANVIPSLDQAD